MPSDLDVGEVLAQDPLHLLDLLAVARGEEDPGRHEPRASRCSRVRSAQPFSASASRASSSARSKAAPSAVPWTSTNLPLAGHHDVHVGLGAHVLDVGQVEARDAVDDADADRGDRAGERLAGQRAGGAQVGDGVGERDVRAGDRGRAGAAVGLEHVAVELDRVLAERLVVDDRAQRAADQPADLVGATADPALDRLAVGAGVGRGREHGVLRRDPAQPGALAPARDAPGGGRRAEHLGARRTRPAPSPPRGRASCG